MRRARFAAATLSMVTMLVLAGAGPAAARAAHHPPPAPTDLAVSGYGSSATLSWRQPPGAPVRSFRVYEGTTVVTRSTTTWAALSNLGFARTRSYTVTAVGPRGLESAHSAVLTRRLGVSGVPPECVPSGLGQLAATRVSPSAVTLTWVNVGDPGVVTVTGGPAGPVSSGLASVRIGGLTPATAYTFSAVRRSACSGPGTPPAAVAVVTPAGPAGHPDAPANPAVSARTDTSLTLSWEPPAGGTPATRYVVYEGGRAVATTGGTSATVRGLYHAVSYGFTVAAVDARGNESPGAFVSGHTATCQTRPPRPVQVRAEPLSASSVRLDWVQEAAAVSYTILAGPTVVGAGAGTSAVVSGLASASTHRLRVTATLAHGCGQTRPSAAAAVTTPAGPTARPSRPEGFRVAAADPPTGTVTLRWSQPAGTDPAVGYRVYRGADLVASAATTSVVLALPMATTHVLTVAALDAAGMESAQSAPLTVEAPYLPPP